VEIVGRGDEALRSIAGRPPDLVILDLNLPVVSGDEVVPDPAPARREPGCCRSSC
jgi:DNA-binding response OmpR family regulator